MFLAVYPRWRGEHTKDGFMFLVMGGLSPLARGTLPVTFHQAPVIRFIPAGAGNTLSTCASHLASSVYPRWRGEHDFPLFFVYRFDGLSPLARGTPWRFVVFDAASRFIPAGAGNTSRRGAISRRTPVYPRWRGEHVSPSVNTL